MTGQRIIATENAGISPESEWVGIVTATDPIVRQAVFEIIGDHGHGLVTRFYDVMMADAHASAYLDHKLVEERLSKGLFHWLSTLFAPGGADKIPMAIAHQRNAGDIHARVRLPISLVGRGARYLKHWIWEYLVHAPQLRREEIQAAIVYTNDLLDLAIEVMNTSFINNSDRATRTDEAYRLFSLGQDLAIERERQRAAMLEWNQQMLHAIYRRPSSAPPKIKNSEFGLWLIHKALFMFEKSSEIEQIMAIAERIDSEIGPQLGAAQEPDSITALLSGLENDVSRIKFLLSALFDRYLKVENGRDVLTKLFDRRFLPSTIMREIDLAKRTNHLFALMLIDIDHFKRVNDTYGHDAGDVVLQQTATLITNMVRAGDFVFRYGGEEILVILVDVEPDVAVNICEDMRRKIERSPIHLNGGRIVDLTVSIGIAIYDGHPDYQRMITRADDALYEAKNTGRNRHVCAKLADDR